MANDQALTASSSIGHIVRHDLNNINGIIQNTHASYIKETIIALLRDEFKKDSYYHYVEDEFGYPKVINMKDMPLGAGYSDDLTTRIYIGEKFRHDVIFYPSIIVSAGSISSTPISFNRDRGTVQYENILVVDESGNYSNVTVPNAFCFVGAWEGTINVDITCRDGLSLDDLIAFCSIFFVDVAHDRLLRAGILVKGVQSGSPSETRDREQEVLYKNTISLSVRSEWQRQIPVSNLIEFINFCVDFGHFDSSDSFEAAPNMSINTIVEADDI